MSSITPVILGLLAHTPISGYDMKRVVDRSTRFFWAGSYGQIYPELRRLEREGLIEGEDAPNGGRTRRGYCLTAAGGEARLEGGGGAGRVYRLAGAGREALREWLLGSATTIEYRDESLLRLFFAEALPREQALTLLAGRKQGHERYLEVLRAIGTPPETDPTFDQLVLQWGIDFNEWGAKWCEQQLQRLRKQKAA